jgi:putative ABC transport system permease protein
MLGDLVRQNAGHHPLSEKSVETLANDLRHAIRSLRRSPGFTLVAFLILAVGIATVTAVFSYMNAIYYSRLPYLDVDRSVAIAESHPGHLAAFNELSPEVFRIVKSSARSFERLASYRSLAPVVTFGTEPHQIRALAVDTSFAPFFGITPQLGRSISADDILGQATATMISDVLWRSRYGADPAVVGKSIAFGPISYRIVGVMPPGFRFPWQTDALVPIGNAPLAGGTSDTTPVEVIARLRHGVTRDMAKKELEVLASTLRASDSSRYLGLSLRVRDEVLDRKGRLYFPAPWFFVGSGIFLLLIAATNVANLLLVRGARRRREMAIRATLGAGRLTLIKTLVTESLLLGLLAAVAGVWLSRSLVSLWLHVVPLQDFPSWFKVVVDWRTTLFAVGVMMFVTAAMSLTPALEATKFDLASSLKQGGDGGGTRSGVIRSSKRGLVIQLALSTALFACALLLLRSFTSLTKIDVGYPADNIARVAPLFDQTRYPSLQGQLSFAEAIEVQARRLPGLKAVAIRGDYSELRSGGRTRFERFGNYDPRLIPDGDVGRALDKRTRVTWYAVSDEYLSLLQLQILRGRELGAQDVPGSPPVAVISAEAARRLWGSRDPIGRTIQEGSRGDRFTVVGVVKDVRDLESSRQGFSADPRLTVYLSTRQALPDNPMIVARSSGPVLPFREGIADLVRASDPNLMILRGTTLASQFDGAFMLTRVLGGVVAAFALGGLVLSVLGIYGVVAYGVVQRTREIGIRIALGGRGSDILRMIIVDGLRFVAVGLGIGIFLAFGLARLEQVVLFGVSPFDPISTMGVALLFGCVGLTACYLPARRAVRVNPLIALRNE